MNTTELTVDTETAPEPTGPVGVATPLLSLRHVSKHFGAVDALSDVTFDILPGTVTALAGDNGAGKSVLVKCIAGIHEPDGGQILWKGSPVTIRTPHDASVLGIETVYQDLALCDNLDIAENMFLGRELRHGLVLDETAMEKAAATTLAGLSVTSVRSIRQHVGSLSGGQRQSVAVARAVLWNSRLVIMDEPTAALGVSQTAMVLAVIKRLAAQGIAVIVISHNLNDVFNVADYIAVVHLGHLVAHGPVGEFDPQTVVELMTTGRHAPARSSAPDRTETATETDIGS
jgi:ABC-type sugar transport system ATPase subunit